MHSQPQSAQYLSHYLCHEFETSPKRAYGRQHCLRRAGGCLLKNNTVGNEYIDMVNVPNISVHTLIFST